MNMLQPPLDHSRRTTALDEFAAIQGDRQLVDEAVAHIQGVLGRTLSRGMMEIGSYLLETFYDGDPGLAQASNPQKHASLRLLVQRCESISLPVSRTFLSNAIRMAAVAKLLPRRAMFLRLPPSHRVELLRMKDPERIEELAERCLQHGLSVPKLRALVQQDMARLRIRSPRGRRRRSPLIRALDTCSQLLREGETGRQAFPRAELAELSLEELLRARRACERLGRRLEELGQLLIS